VIHKKKSYADAVNQRPPVSQLESGKKYRSSRGSGTLTIIFSPTSVKIMTRRRLPRGFPPRNLSWIFTRIPLSCIGSPRAPAIIRILTGLVFNGLNKCSVFIGPRGRDLRHSKPFSNYSNFHCPFQQAPTGVFLGPLVRSVAPDAFLMVIAVNFENPAFPPGIGHATVARNLRVVIFGWIGLLRVLNLRPVPSRSV
jgi:hypothetical protein